MFVKIFKRHSSFYSILQVSPKSTKKEIKAAFYKLAQKHHPDVNPDNESAHAKFLQINQAYSVLSDDLKRREYDSSTAQNSIFSSNRHSSMASDRPSTRVTKHDIRPEDWIQFKRSNTDYTQRTRAYDFQKHQDIHYDSRNMSRADRRRMEELNQELDLARMESKRSFRVMINLCLIATLVYFFMAGYMDVFFK